MKRKIEKFLASKTGVDEAEIEPSEDGRYGLKDDDLEAMLTAVRDREGTFSGPVKGTSRILANAGSVARPSRTSAESKSATARNSSSAYRHLPIAANATTGGYYPHPYHNPSYPMGSFPPHPANMYHFPPQHLGKENNGMYPGMPPYWAIRNAMTTTGPPVLRSPHKNDHNYLLSAKKSIFDSPPKNDDFKASQNAKESSPPMTDFRNTFATPLAAMNESTLSQEEVLSLNKTLFSEEVMSTPFLYPVKPTSTKAATVVRISIGSDSKLRDYRKARMKINNRVSISPMHPQKKGGATSSFFDDDEELSKSVMAVLQKDDLDKEMMPPPTAPRTVGRPSRDRAHFTNSLKKMGDVFSDQTPHVDNVLTPFDSCKMAQHLTTTPSTVAMEDTSFWREEHEYSGMSPVPLSPFHSPGPFSTQKKVRLRSPACFNTTGSDDMGMSSSRKRRLDELHEQ